MPACHCRKEEGAHRAVEGAGETEKLSTSMGNIGHLGSMWIEGTTF